MRASQMVIAGGLLLTGVCITGMAQEAGTLPEQQAPQQAAPPGSTPAPAPPSNKFTVPAGTKVLLSIKSAVNTKTARPGDGVYLESTFPVVVDGHVLIPPGVYVQGVLDRVVRPGRVKGRAEVSMHFTSMIFPNGTAIQIPGVVNSLPGSSSASVKDSEGTIQQAGSKGKDAGTVVKTTAAGAGLGTIAGEAGGNGLAGAGYGAAAGLVGGGLYTLFTRGDEVAIPQGAVIEMVLQRPLQVEETTYAPAPEMQPLMKPPMPPQNPNMIVPQAGQQQPMAKPKQMVCPSGELGCGQ